MAGDAVHFGDDNADDVGLLRDLLRQVAELLDRQRVGEVHVHPRQVVHAVGVGDEHDRRDVFADLLGAAVQVAKVRRHFGDDLAVGAQDEAEHAMGAGVLRAHVHQHLVGPNVELDDGLVFFFRGTSGGPAVDLQSSSPFWIDPAAACECISRMALARGESRWRWATEQSICVFSSVPSGN